MREIIHSVTVNKLTAVYRKETTSGTVELLLIPAGTQENIIRTDCAAESLVQLKLQGDDEASFFSGGRTMRNSPSTFAMKFDNLHQHGTNGAISVTSVLKDNRGFKCTHTLTLYDNGCATVTTSFYNGSNAPITLEMLSSFTLGSLSPFCTGLNDSNLVIHRMLSTWSAEGRLISEKAEDLQLEPSWKCYSANSVRFGSIGSFPVRGYVPFCAVEDTKNGIIWAAATTHGSSWQIELYRRDLGLSLSGGLADREFGQWCKTLAKHESFTAPTAVITTVKGNIDAASQAIAENMRQNISLPKSEIAMPVIFNEFCISWGKPTYVDILKQIEVLKDKGIDYYVIDAGWYDDSAFEAASRLGKWEVSKKAFPNGIKAAVDAIHNCGMKAGIWFELEVVGRDETSCFNKTDWLLKRNGIPITAGDRRFWDMRRSDVQEYLAERVIAFVRKNDFNYLKIDYNETIGIGCDGYESLGEGLRCQIEAVQSFFSRITHELPDLVLELCSSGGHRLCQSFAQLGSMCSFSDAHECDEIPIIAANMHRIILPRQSQIWVVVKAGQPLQKLYYQICSGMLGRLCFSGDIESLSSQQWSIIAQGIAFYKKATPVIDCGTSSRFGSAVTSYRHPCGWQCMLRKGTEYSLAVVHTFDNSPDQIQIPVSGVIDSVFACNEISVKLKNNTLTVSRLSSFNATAILIKNI